MFFIVIFVITELQDWDIIACIQDIDAATKSHDSLSDHADRRFLTSISNLPVWKVQLKY